MARVTVVFPPLRVSRDFIDYPYFADLGAAWITEGGVVKSRSAACVTLRNSATVTNVRSWYSSMTVAFDFSEGSLYRRRILFCPT